MPRPAGSRSVTCTWAARCRALDDHPLATEDTPLAIAVIDNDPGASAATDSVLIVQGPAHGQVSVGADGVVTYTPDADYYGSDSFSYRLLETGSGRLSNIAVVTLQIASVNDAPVALPDSGSLGEDDAALQVAAAQGVIQGAGADSDVEHDMLTVVGVAAGTPASVAPGGVGSTVAGLWGSLTLYADGSYLYAPSAAAQSLLSGQSVADVFSYLIDDGHGGLASSVLSITVVGSDDAAAVGGSLTGAVAEDGVLSSSGLLSVFDPDAGQSGFIAQAGTAGAYGSLTLDGSGHWSYTLANGLAAVQELVSGQQVVEQFAVKSLDGTVATLTITLNGSDDAAVIGGTSGGAVSEDGTLVSSGALSIVDPDAGQAAFLPVTDRAGIYGVLSLNAAGEWTYTLNNGAANVQALWAGQVVNDSFTVSSIDGTSRTVTIVVTGANDVAVIGGTATGAVSEDGTLSATGTLTVVDPTAVKRRSRP